MNLKKMSILALAAISVFGATAAFADPTIVNVIPTPATLAVGTFQVGGTYANAQHGWGDLVTAKAAIFRNVELEYTHDIHPDNNESLDLKATLINDKTFKLGVGTLGLESLGKTPEFYGVAGLYSGRSFLVAGDVRTNSKNDQEAIVGAGYDLTKTVGFRTDYRTGAGNYATVGLKLASGSVEIDPVLLYSNTNHQAGEALTLKYTTSL